MTTNAHLANMLADQLSDLRETSTPAEYKEIFEARLAYLATYSGVISDEIHKEEGGYLDGHFRRVAERIWTTLNTFTTPNFQCDQGDTFDDHLNDCVVMVDGDDGRLTGKSCGNPIHESEFLHA